MTSSTTAKQLAAKIAKSRRHKISGGFDARHAFDGSRFHNMCEDCGRTLQVEIAKHPTPARIDRFLKETMLPGMYVYLGQTVLIRISGEALAYNCGESRP
jgi:hypothetical protein